jgi:hypothetical protein
MRVDARAFAYACMLRARTSASDIAALLDGDAAAAVKEGIAAAQPLSERDLLAALRAMRASSREETVRRARDRFGVSMSTLPPALRLYYAHRLAEDDGREDH